MKDEWQVTILCPIRPGGYCEACQCSYVEHLFSKENLPIRRAILAPDELARIRGGSIVSGVDTVVP